MKKKELAKRLTRLEWNASKHIVSLETHNSDLLERVKVLEDAMDLLIVELGFEVAE